MRPSGSHVRYSWWRGEKDADNLTKIGIVATCNAGGAHKWRQEHSRFLRGADVVVIPDNDAAGRKHAEAVVSLVGVAARIRTPAQGSTRVMGPLPTATSARSKRARRSLVQKGLGRGIHPYGRCSRIN